MSKRSSSRTSRTDRSRVRAMTDRDIAVSVEHPETSVKHIARGIVRRGLNQYRPKHPFRFGSTPTFSNGSSLRVPGIRRESMPSCVHSKRHRPNLSLWRHPVRCDPYRGVDSWRTNDRF